MRGALGLLDDDVEALPTGRPLDVDPRAGAAGVDLEAITVGERLAKESVIELGAAAIIRARLPDHLLAGHQLDRRVDDRRLADQDAYRETIFGVDAPLSFILTHLVLRLLAEQPLPKCPIFKVAPLTRGELAGLLLRSLRCLVPRTLPTFITVARPLFVRRVRSLAVIRGVFAAVFRNDLAVIRRVFSDRATIRRRLRTTGITVRIVRTTCGPAAPSY